MGDRAVRRLPGMRRLLLAAALMALQAAAAARPDAARIDWQLLDGFAIARTETTVGQFRRFGRSLRHA